MRSFSETRVSNNYIQRKNFAFFIYSGRLTKLTAAHYQKKTTHSGVGGKKQSNDLAVTPAHISWFLSPAPAY